MTLYLQDSGANSHPLWTDEALDAGVADGAIISPFFTPNSPRKGHLTGADYADRVRSHNGAVLFDATTHGVSWPATSNWVNYNTWDLWPGTRGDLSNVAARDEHVSRVFAHQDRLGAPRLTPTLALDNALGAEADRALAVAEAGRQADAAAWQSLAGRRGFWLSADLDAYVGSLQQLAAPVWVVTHVRETDEYPADSSESAQLEALCRTVDSLSRRSRVVLGHSDLAGLPGVAAGAEAVGTGWHTKQRLCSTTSYQANDPSIIRRQADWYTYRGLMARIHKNENTVLKRFDLSRAQGLYTGSIDDGARDRRLHHLQVVNELVDDVVAAGPGAARVATLRALYENASAELDSLTTSLGRAFAAQRAAHVDGLYEGLRDYAVAEGTWGP